MKWTSGRCGQRKPLPKASLLEGIVGQQPIAEIARAIDHLVAPQGDQIIAKRDRFGDPQIKDIDWIQALDAESGWSFISLDTHIRRRPAELAVLRRTKVTAFFMLSAWQRFKPVEQAGQLMLWWPKLKAAFETNRPGTIFSLPWRMSSKLRRLPA